MLHCQPKEDQSHKTDGLFKYESKNPKEKRQWLNTIFSQSFLVAFQQKKGRTRDHIMRDQFLGAHRCVSTFKIEYTLGFSVVIMCKKIVFVSHKKAFVSSFD